MRAFAKLHWAARDIASSSPCSVELHTSIPLPTVSKDMWSLIAPVTLPVWAVPHHMATRGKYPDSGTWHTVEGVAGLPASLAEHQRLQSEAWHE